MGARSVVPKLLIGRRDVRDAYTSFSRLVPFNHGCVKRFEASCKGLIFEPKPDSLSGQIAHRVRTLVENGCEFFGALAPTFATQGDHQPPGLHHRWLTRSTGEIINLDIKDRRARAQEIHGPEVGPLRAGAPAQHINIRAGIIRIEIPISMQPNPLRCGHLFGNPPGLTASVTYRGKVGSSR